ncbi:MAG: hypothetical protein Q9220_006665 [cf. Caloplaca sp. 1 TL-2023]
MEHYIKRAIDLTPRAVETPHTMLFPGDTNVYNAKEKRGGNDDPPMSIDPNQPMPMVGVPGKDERESGGSVNPNQPPHKTIALPLAKQKRDQPLSFSPKEPPQTVGMLGK